MSLVADIRLAPKYPQRIVCLTEETTETLYRLGAEGRIVGVSGFTVRPRRARREKPTVSTFLDADFERILALEPDLVLGFSDLQADIGRELAKRGVAVVLFNQRSLVEILQAIRVVGALVGLADRADRLADDLAANLERTAEAAKTLSRRPRILFEEWPDPLITGIRWVSELIELAGGHDCFAENRAGKGAAQRIVTPEEAARRAPEAIIASWCGKKANYAKIRGRPGWHTVPAVIDDQLYEIKSETILQPGPAALTDGLAQLAAIVRAVASRAPLEERKPGGMRHAEHVLGGSEDWLGEPTEAEEEGDGDGP